MIQPIDSLTFSLYHSRGVFVPLVGSGVSRSAAIPTGWEVVKDLIRRLASQQGHQVVEDPVRWYMETTGHEPNYSELLSQLAPGNAERQAILRSYFEPTDDDRLRNLKTPTAAHRSIAELVARGYFRAIVSTNFDRLFEQALEERGIRPVVVASAADIEGAIPLAHSKCTLIKLHGDYLDTRIRNTERELSKYPPALRTLLKQVLEEYGLVICGWSAQWDDALRQAIAAARNRRYLTFWTARLGNLSEEAKRLIALRSAVTIDISSADDFWPTVLDRLVGLEKFDRRHPVSVAARVEEAKRYIPDNGARIALYDLISSEMEAAYESLFSVDDLSASPEPSLYLTKIESYEAKLELLERLVVTGTRWADPVHDDLWIRTIERIGNPPSVKPGSFYETWELLQYYPAARLLYCGGIGALLARRYDLLWRLLTVPQLQQPREPQGALALHANQYCLDGQLLQKSGAAIQRWPENQYFFESLRAVIKDQAPSEHEYSRFFEMFQYFLSLVLVHLGEERGCPGRFAYTRSGHRVETQLLDEITRYEEKWKPLRQGFFDGQLTLLQNAIAKQSAARAQWIRGY